MRVKGLITEDFSNYKEPSMFIISSFCDWKCCSELGLDIGVCQNASLVSQRVQRISTFRLYEVFEENPITRAVVIGGLEPMLQFFEIKLLIEYFRYRSAYCPFIVYTGYYQEEIQEQISELSQFENIIIKFGRYVPNLRPKFDPILGVQLASENQYAVKIS